MSRPTFQPRAMARGFTLIELIVVIVILGVLAAVALPRFTSLQSDARVAKANALAGSIRAAASLAKSTALVKGQACNADVTMEALAVTMINCYPTGAVGGIVAAANISETNDGVVLGYVVGPPGVTTVTMSGATDAATCRVTYTAAAADAAPTIAVATGGC